MRKKKKCLKCGYWNHAEAQFCNLCYEPFNRTAATAADKPAAASPGAPAPAGPRGARKWALLAATAVLAAALAAALSLSRKNLTEQAPGPQVNRFSEKTGAADKLLADYIAAKESLLAEIAAAPADPEAFGIAGAYTAKLFDIEENYAQAIEALQLPRLGEADKVKDALYLEWMETHRGRETAAMNAFSAKYQDQIRRAGAAPGP